MGGWKATSRATALSFHGCARSPRALPPRLPPHPFLTNFTIHHFPTRLLRMLVSLFPASAWSPPPSPMCIHAYPPTSLSPRLLLVLSLRLCQRRAFSLEPCSHLLFSLTPVTPAFFCVFFLARLRLAANPRYAAPGSPSLLCPLALHRHLHPLLPDFSIAYFLLYTPLLSP